MKICTHSSKFPTRTLKRILFSYINILPFYGLIQSRIVFMDWFQFWMNRFFSMLKLPLFVHQLARERKIWAKYWKIFILIFSFCHHLEEQNLFVLWKELLQKQAFVLLRQWSFQKYETLKHFYFKAIWLLLNLTTNTMRAFTWGTVWILSLTGIKTTKS